MLSGAVLPSFLSYKFLIKTITLVWSFNEKSLFSNDLFKKNINKLRLSNLSAFSLEVTYILTRTVSDISDHAIKEQLTQNKTSIISSALFL